MDTTMTNETPKENVKETTKRTPQKPTPEKESAFLNFLLNLIIPVIILTKFSSNDYLGPLDSLIVALMFPIGYGTYDFVKRKNINFFSIIGFLSIVLTGGIGILQLDPKWLAIKEAMVPLLFGGAILISQFTPYPLLKKLIEKVINEEQVMAALVEKNTIPQYNKRLNVVTYIVALSFLLSSTLNFLLASYIVVSQPGTEAFNEELGKLTALSYPMIAIPSTIVLGLGIWYLIMGIKTFTGMKLEEIFSEEISQLQEEAEKKSKAND